MVKAIYEAVSATIPRRELVDAMGKFLIHSEFHKDTILVQNIDSPEFGSSDLLFVNKVKTNLSVARLNNRGQCEKIVISSICYYLWFREIITVSKIFFNGMIGIDMYLFSHDFSAAICYLIENLYNKFRINLIKYNILQAQDLDEPTIYFQRMTSKDLIQDNPLKNQGLEETAQLMEEKEPSAFLDISAQELSEFNRLKELYLT